MQTSPSQLERNQTEAQAHPGLLSPERWLTLALDLIYPPCCAGCGRVDTVWCPRCQHEIETAPLSSTPLEAISPLAGLASTALHRGRIQQAVQALKYERVTALADVLAGRLVARLNDLHWSFDTLVPVPLHIQRQRQRGYNQSQLLAEAVAATLMIPCLPFALERQRDTRPQVGLTRTQRQHNVADAFYGDRAALAGRIVLLIDDVTTTGSTLAACAQAAQAAGASAIFGLTVTSAS